jgi:hypothetical protein
MQEIATLPSEVPLIIVNRTSGNVFGSNRPDEAGYGQPTAYFDQPVTSPTREFQAEFARRLAASAGRIARVRPVYLVRPLPEMPVDVPKVAARKQLIWQPVAIGVSLADYRQRYPLVWAAHDRAHEDCGAQSLDPLPWLCDDTQCPALKNSRPLYYDSHHFSEYGNRYLVPMLQQVFHATDQHG